YSGTDARDRHWDGHWRAGCPAPANPNSHSPHADKSAARCRPHAGVGSSGAWGRAAQEGTVWETRCLVHTGHNGAFSSVRQRAWARWHVDVWTWLARLAGVYGGPTLKNL